jgi:glycosyltransferase involved in cell wall biosynthesis
LNAERFIQEAIESVFAQGYEPWELLLIDDGSTDESTGIARRYTAQYPERVRYFEHAGHQNRGLSASRNLGIRHAQGEYVAFLDADDVWLPHKLAQQVAILNANPEAGMVYGASQYWHSWTGNPEDIRRDYILKLGVEADSLIRPHMLLTLSLESRAPTPCPSDILLRREVIENVGGFEETFRGIYLMYEDQAFLAKVYLSTPVFVANACWDKYRLHPDSCVAVVTRAGQKYSAGLYYLNWLVRYLSEQGVKDVEVWQALRKKRWRYRHPTLYRLLVQMQSRRWQLKERVKIIAHRILPISVDCCLNKGARGRSQTTEPRES